MLFGLPWFDGKNWDSESANGRADELLSKLVRAPDIVYENAMSHGSAHVPAAIWSMRVGVVLWWPPVG